MLYKFNFFAEKCCTSIKDTGKRGFQHENAKFNDSEYR